MTKLVILGATTTALGVIRNAHLLGMESIVADVSEDVASYSSLCQSVVWSQGQPDILNRIVEFGDEGRNYLIATSDDWVKFIVAHRDSIDNAYYSVLHATNDALNICLNKKLFIEWCETHKFPVPKRFTLTEITSTASSSLRFPLFIRPMTTLHSDAGAPVPKAVEVNSVQELQQWLGYYKNAGLEPLITESLLKRDLRQYSVVVANNGRSLLSFVAEKIRPLASQCAVGTFVRLSPNEEVEALGRDVIRQLDYYGICEIEILHCTQSGNNYLIEINARPWLQYSLSYKSGHDLLQFLLRPQDYDSTKEQKTGKNWLDFRSDFYVCFSGQGLVRNSIISVFEYIKSILSANVYAKFSFADPKPFFQDVRMFLAMLKKPKQALKKAKTPLGD